MHGYLLVDKPKGWTSFDAVNYVRRMVQHNGLNTTGRKRFPVGHTGTLDPMATGLLVLLLGSYTKRATELTKLDKTYEVTMKLGETSTTGDQEGVKTATSDCHVEHAELEAALQKFVGDIMQTPPIYSAMKVNGQRAYKLAREGKEVKLEPRPASIRDITLTGYDYPYATFTTEVSSGTYIRSLVEDVGNELGVGAYMSDLRRTKVGRFDIAEAVAVDEITASTLAVREL
jgi:tRNA pseudouridine55 synthase